MPTAVLVAESSTWSSLSHVNLSSPSDSVTVNLFRVRLSSLYQQHRTASTISNRRPERRVSSLSSVIRNSDLPFSQDWSEFLHAEAVWRIIFNIYHMFTDNCQHRYTQWFRHVMLPYQLSHYYYHGLQTVYISHIACRKRRMLKPIGQSWRCGENSDVLAGCFVSALKPTCIMGGALQFF